MMTNTTEKNLIVESSIFISAKPGKVWEVLTQPEFTRKYMFGCEPVTNWKVGSPLFWKGTFNGQEMVAVKGKVADVLKNKSLIYTTIDPNSDIPDVAENYTTVTYTLTPQKDGTQLTITQGDFAKVAKGEKRYEETISGGGWTAILKEIKQLAEG